jgi:hypothetical protein
MRTSFHHQPEAQHPNFQLSTSWPADYPIYWGKTGKRLLVLSPAHLAPRNDAELTFMGFMVAVSALTLGLWLLPV